MTTILPQFLILDEANGTHLRIIQKCPACGAIISDREIDVSQFSIGSVEEHQMGADWGTSAGVAWRQHLTEKHGGRA